MGVIRTSAALPVVLQQLPLGADAVKGPWAADTLELTAVLHRVTQVHVCNAAQDTLGHAQDTLGHTKTTRTLRTTWICRGDASILEDTLGIR